MSSQQEKFRQLWEQLVAEGMDHNRAAAEALRQFKAAAQQNVEEKDDEGAEMQLALAMSMSKDSDSTGETKFTGTTNTATFATTSLKKMMEEMEEMEEMKEFSSQPPKPQLKVVSGLECSKFIRETNEETISKSFVEADTVTTFYKDEFPSPSHDLLEAFQKSAQQSKDGILYNAYNHYKSSPTAQKIRLVNLKNTTLNGQCGTRTIWDEKKRRFKVILDDVNARKREIKVKPENIEILPAPTCHHWRCSAWNFEKCSDCGTTLDPKRLDAEKAFAEKLKQEDSMKTEQRSHNDRIHSLGIRVDALLAFTYAHDCWDWTTKRVVRDIIVPATRETRCRYGELPETSCFFGKATVFASHTWGAKFGDLVGAVCHGAKKDRIVWIDIFAVRQWPGNRDDLDFRQVLKRCKAEIVCFSVANSLGREFYVGTSQERIDTFLASQEGIRDTAMIPVFRLWCIVEIAAAVNMKIPLVIKSGRALKRIGGTYYFDISGGLNMMNNLIYMVNAEKSKCANKEDFVREMNVITNMEGGVNGVNKIVEGVLSGAVISIKYNVLEVDAAICGETESLFKLKMNSLSSFKETKLAMHVFDAACSAGRVNVVRLLINKWIGKENDPLRKEKMEWLCKVIDYSRVVWGVASGGHAEVLEMLLKGVEGVFNLNVSLENGSTALWEACHRDHLEVVHLLLQENDIKVNKPRTTDGVTPLYTACELGHTSIVDLLLQHHAINVNQPKKAGENPLYAACYQGYTSVVALLLKHHTIQVNQACLDDGSTPLYIACHKGHISIVDLLLQKNDINVNQQNYDPNRTPLYIASACGHVEIVRLLLQMPNIDLKKQTRAMFSPLDAATQMGHYEIIELLKAAESAQIKIMREKKDEDDDDELQLALALSLSMSGK